MHVGIIGQGSIGGTLAEMIQRDPVFSGVALTAMVRPGRSAALATVHDAAGLVAAGPDLVVECAGHSAVGTAAAECLAAGIDTVVASIGALADDELRRRLFEAARAGGARMILPAGAIGGTDLLAALKPSGISSVIYEGRKPPAAWAGSPAEQACDLQQLTRATTFFDGSAREAALRYPKNANVAATLALAGLGFDDTQVRLIADPSATGNTHSYSVTSGGADYQVSINGKPSPENPKTSMATVYSLLREVRNRVGPVVL